MGWRVRRRVCLISSSLLYIYFDMRDIPSNLYTYKVLTQMTFLTGTPLLIPLTTSLYVPGTLSSSRTVLVDIGTGFYVEKSVAESKKFYEGKVADLQRNLGEIENVVGGKEGNLRVVEEVLRGRVMSEQGQAQGGQQGGAGGGGGGT